MNASQDPSSSPNGLRLMPQADARRDGLANRRAPRKAPTPRKIARRSWMVTIAKRLLPVVALALLTTVAFWPEISRDTMRARLAINRGIVDPESGRLTLARYNGVDDEGRRYTVTADSARQVSPDRIDLSAPIGDLTMQNDSWVWVRSKAGVYMQQAQQLDLSGDVTIYRDDGITLSTDSASVDLKQGAAASSSRVHVEGPFGTLDAQGFALLDSGAVVQFSGPGRLVLNGHSK